MAKGRMHQQSISEKGSFTPELMVHFPNFQCTNATNNQLAKRIIKSANFINWPISAN
jgi:hypothetical protein